MTQPTHLELAVKIGRLETILEPLPQRLDNIEEKMDKRHDELRAEIASLKEARSHLVGIGVGIGMAFTFLASLLGLAANGLLEKFRAFF
jgi:hypothetical protein